MGTFGAKCPWTMPEGFRKKDASLVGTECWLGTKTNIKQSVVGAKSRVGSRSKINNCIIMEGVTIGDK
ncbi:unnamed protein product [Choristocarpus tenellus]